MARAPFVSIKALGPGSAPTVSNLVSAISSELAQGHLLGGMRLPPVRVLQRQLGISKNTVQAAYDELAARDLVETRPREGVFVKRRHPHADQVHLRQWNPPSLAAREFSLPLLQRSSDDMLLGHVFIDPDLLPRKQLTDCYRSVLQSPGLPTFYEAAGPRPLRQWVATRLNERGMEVGVDDVIMTSGSQQALELVSRTLRTGPIATENPVYGYAKQLFESTGHHVFGLPLCPFNGVDFDLWEQLLARHRPGLVYLITSFQNPTGFSYSTQDLLRILELSERFQFTLLEDDWGSDMLSDSEYRPTLRALGGQNVLYCNSFTKKLLPSLRVGYLVSSPGTTSSLISAKRLSCLGSATLNELALCEFLDRGYYDTHLERIHGQLDHRYQQCVHWLRTYMPPDAKFSLPGGGPCLWFEVPPGTDLARLRADCAQRKVVLQDADTFFFGEPHLNGFRIGYAYHPPEVLAEGLRVLWNALRDQGFVGAVPPAGES